jgi:hypothetical protein
MDRYVKKVDRPIHPDAAMGVIKNDRARGTGGKANLYTKRA